MAISPFSVTAGHYNEESFPEFHYSRSAAVWPQNSAYSFARNLWHLWTASST